MELKINHKRIAFKVTTNNNDMPYSIRRDSITELIKKSGIFEYCGKSRIDNAPMFVLDETQTRRMKIEKLTNNYSTYNKINKLFSFIDEKEIEYITLNN